MSAFTHIARRFIVPATGARSDRLRLVFDIEADELLNAATTVHCIVIIDLDSGQIYEYGPGQISAALAHLARADVLIGHNITGYDLPLLDRLHNWQPKAGCVITDTLVASRLILPDVTNLDDQAAGMGDAKLGKLRGSYKLEAWGARLGIPKVGADITDFSVWTPELQERCVGDAALTKVLWQFLQPDGYSQQALGLEHHVALICNRITADGVPFDVDAAERLHQQWTARRAALVVQLRQQFPGIKNWNSRKQIIALLMARGWVPEKFTDKGNPSLDEEVLADVARIYPEFAGLSEYFALGVLIGKIITGPKSCCNNVTPDGRIHNAPIHIRTPHSRAQYSNPNLGGMPNPKKGKPVGSECRTLFRDNNGWVFVACDQAALQDRGLAHYLHPFDGGAYGRAFLAGIDTHWQTSIALGLVPKGTARNKSNKVHEAIRESGGKRFRFAFLYGCGPPKAGIIIYDVARAVQQIDRSSDLQQRFFGSSERPSEAALRRVGSQVLDLFLAATPGLQNLRASLENQARKHGWLPGLDGRRVPARALYTALNFQVTSAEAVVCKRWLVQVYEELRERFRYGPEGDAYIVLWLHDEIVVCCRPEIAEQVGEILTRHAKEAGEHYGLRVPLAAEYQIGRSWAGEPVEVGAEPVTPETAPESTPVTITSDEGLQVVSAGAEPAAITEPAPETMSESTSTAPKMMPAVDDDLHDGLGDDFDDDLGDDRYLDNARLYDVDSALPSATVPAGGAAAAGTVPAEPAPPTSVDFGTLTAAPMAAEVQPSKPNGAGAAAGEGATPSERAGGNGAARGNGYDGGGSKIFCPFHDDHTTPNLHIYADENDPHYHCFTCLAHGPLSELDDLGVNWRATASTTHAQADAAKTLSYAHQLWGQARPILGTLAERYLVHARGIDVGALPPDIEEVLRFHPSCPFNGKGHLPCLIALFRDVETDAPAGIHRIALTPEVFAGAKVERQMLGRWAKPRAIKLWPATNQLFWGEGIETIAAAATHVEYRGAPMRPAWAAGTGGGLGKLSVIPGVERLIILVDNDLNGAGQAAATRCATRWSRVGRTVIKLTPKRPGADFNDIAKEKAP